MKRNNGAGEGHEIGDGKERCFVFSQVNNSVLSGDWLASRLCQLCRSY
jgi:hypothetical protein